MFQLFAILGKKLQEINLYQAIFQSSVDGILVVDGDGVIVLANPTVGRLFAYNFEELIGKNIEILIPKKLTRPYKKFIQNPNPLLKVEKDIFGIKKNGSQFPLELSLNPININGQQGVILFVIDITERRLTKEALSDTQFRMAEAQRLSHIGSWYWNIQTGESNWSDEFYRICGLPPKDKRLNANTVLDFIHPDDRENTLKALHHAIENKTTYRLKKRILRFDGTIRNVISESKVVYGPDGEAIEVLGTIQDITENKIISDALDELNRKFTTLINNLQGIVFQRKDDKDYTMSFISETCYTISGYTPEQFYNGEVSWSAIIHPDDRDYVWNKIQKAKLERQAYQVEYRIITADNEIKWIQESGMAILAENGKTFSFEGYIQDITVQKKNEEKLSDYQKKLKKYSEKLEKEVANRTRELTTTVQKLVASNLSLEDQILETQEAKNRAIANKSLSSAIANNFPNGFIIIFNSDFKILLLEGEALKKFDIDAKNIKGISVDDIVTITKEQKTKLKQDILKTIAGEHLSFESIYKNRHYSVNTTLLQDENIQLANALFIYNDITLQKESESLALKALKKERDLNELKSRFVSMASHEFRTPLSAIQTSTILISKKSEAAKEVKLDKYVEQINRNVKHLDVILNDFLSLSKLEEGKVKAQLEKTDLISFCKSLLDDISITKKEGQNIVLSTTDHPLILQLDPKLLHHVIMNLLSNAIKYSPKNTTIHFKIIESDQFVILEIRDQGIGIPKDEQDKLFERFFRAKNAQNIEGTGLGLNIVKQYVVIMNGTIDVKSEIDQGTTFILKWPKNN